MPTPSDQTELTFLRLLERTKKLCDNVETNAHKIQAAADQLEVLLNKMHELNKWVYTYKISKKFWIFSFLTINEFYGALTRVLKRPHPRGESKNLANLKSDRDKFFLKKEEILQSRKQRARTVHQRAQATPNN